MLTDAPPRKNRSGFVESDRIITLDLPPNSDLQEIAYRLESTMKTENIRDVRTACIAFLSSASNFYAVPTCGVRVLAARPLRTREHGTFELFGDYTPEPMLIRVWMRTAVCKEVTSFGTFVSTLCHEFCHHLDFQKFGFPDSWHTRGFYERGGCAVPPFAGDTVAFFFFVLIYEEPTLRKSYGRDVPRWIPRLRPWLGPW